MAQGQPTELTHIDLPPPAIPPRPPRRQMLLHAIQRYIDTIWYAGGIIQYHHRLWCHPNFLSQRTEQELEVICSTIEQDEDYMERVEFHVWDRAAPNYFLSPTLSIPQVKAYHLRMVV